MYVNNDICHKKLEQYKVHKVKAKKFTVPNATPNKLNFSKFKHC